MFYNPDGESAYDSAEKKVVFSAPVKRITFNPVKSNIDDIARALLPAKQLGWRAKEDDGSLSDCAFGKPISADSDAIYSVYDSDYQSIDLEFLNGKEVPLSPIKDNMDVDTASGSSKRARTNPLDEANQISKLAKKYDQRVQETRAAKGLEVEQGKDDNCEITRIGLKVDEPAAKAAKLDYREAPTLTLSELIPTNFQPTAGAAAAGNLHSSFRAEKVEFVLMMRKLVATSKDDLEWDLPDLSLIHI